MGTTAIIFLILMVVVTGFTASVLINELRSRRKQSVSESETAAAPSALTVATAATPTQDEQAPVAATLTHEEKYDALPEEARSLYDEIAAYAAAVEGATSKISKSSEQYAIGSKKIVRLSIKNDVVACSFALRNLNVFAHEGESKIMISTASITTKITDSERVSAAKNTIDTVVRSINEEKELKLQLAEERRKKKSVQADNREGDAQ